MDFHRIFEVAFKCGGKDLSKRIVIGEFGINSGNIKLLLVLNIDAQRWNYKTMVYFILETRWTIKELCFIMLYNEDSVFKLIAICKIDLMGNPKSSKPLESKL